MIELKRLARRTVLFALVVGAAPAFAQQEKGDTSLAGYGSFQFTKVPSFDTTGRGTSDSGGTNTTGLVGVQFGKFATKQLEVGVLSQLIISGGGGSGTVVVGLIGGYTKYYFGKDRTRPYLGFQAGADITQAPGFDSTTGNASDSSTTTNFRANLTAGVRNYITRNGALFIELNYGATFGGGSSDQFASDTTSSSTKWDSYPSVVFGFSIVF
jgi:hypothetical protein